MATTTASNQKQANSRSQSRKMSNSQDDILAAIEEFLAEETEPTAPPPAPAVEKPRAPRVGTVIQRSDRENAVKAAMLAAPPPPPPGRRPPRPYERRPPPPTRETPVAVPELLVPMGPVPAPPILVQVEPGLVFEVPHFAVHVSRRYRPRTADGQWILRFSRDGKLRYHRRIR